MRQCSRCGDDIGEDDTTFLVLRLGPQSPVEIEVCDACFLAINLREQMNERGINIDSLERISSDTNEDQSTETEVTVSMEVLLNNRNQTNVH